MFTSKEPCSNHQRKNILGPRFVVPAQITANSWHVGCVTNLELLYMCSITLPHIHLNITIQYHAMDNILDDLLPFSLPWTMTLQVQNKSAQTNNILDAITYSKGTQCKYVQCYSLKKTQSYSTGLTLIRPTLIPLLYLSRA